MSIFLEECSLSFYSHNLLTLSLSSLFNCVLNVRRLHVLLGRTQYRQTCLPLLCVQSCLRELLAMMHIYFASTGSGLDMLRNGKSSSAKSSPGKSEVTDFNAYFSEFIDRNANNGPPLAVAVVHRTESRRSSAEEQQGVGNEEYVTSWEPLYIKSAAGSSNTHDSIFKRRDQGPTLDATESGGDRVGLFSDWSTIENALTTHSALGTNDVKTYVCNTVIDGKFPRRGSNSNHSKCIAHCYIVSITTSMCLIVVQEGSGHGKRNRLSDDEVHLFMRNVTSKLLPNHLFRINIVTSLKSELFGIENKLPDHPTTANNLHETASLWSESGWSDTQRKKILHSLGLRRKNSPVMAPLKSPYVQRKLGRQRKKKMKNSVNHGHLDLFLGPELSRLL